MTANWTLKDQHGNDWTPAAVSAIGEEIASAGLTGTRTGEIVGFNYDGDPVDADGYVIDLYDPAHLWDRWAECAPDGFERSYEYESEDVVVWVEYLTAEPGLHEYGAMMCDGDEKWKLGRFVARFGLVLEWEAVDEVATADDEAAPADDGPSFTTIDWDHADALASRLEVGWTGSGLAAAVTETIEFLREVARLAREAGR